MVVHNGFDNRFYVHVWECKQDPLCKLNYLQAISKPSFDACRLTFFYCGYGWVIKDVTKLGNKKRTSLVKAKVTHFSWDLHSLQKCHPPPPKKWVGIHPAGPNWFATDLSNMLWMTYLQSQLRSSKIKRDQVNFKFQHCTVYTKVGQLKVKIIRSCATCLWSFQTCLIKIPFYFDKIREKPIPIKNALIAGP